MKITQIFAILAVSPSLMSCNFLDEFDPNATPAGNFYTSEADIETSLNGVYQSLAQSYYLSLIHILTLEDIAVNLEHWYNIRIRIDDGVDASTRISFTLRPETLDETLRIIENLTHFACERTDRQHITIRKR